MGLRRLLTILRFLQWCPYGKLGARPGLLWELTECQPWIGSSSLSCCPTFPQGVEAGEQGTGIDHGETNVQRFPEIRPFMLPGILSICCLHREKHQGRSWQSGAHGKWNVQFE